MTFYTLASSWGQSFVFVILGLMVLFSLRLTQADPHVVSGFVIVLIYITSPMQVILNLLPAINRANVALAKVEQLGLELSANVEGSWEDPGAPEADWNELELDGVTYIYQREADDTPFTLGPVDLTLRQGELVFITGGNGSGKTTFAKLLSGLYHPAGGVIRLNGRVINEDNVEYYRQHFSTVFSDFYLFEDFPGLGQRTLGSNVKDYLDRLQLSQKVQFGDGKLSTLKLSHGQRKRLALLTAYLEDRPIYLFDEWAADQDPHFKDIFYNQILRELKAAGKTALVITHDDRYYHLADRLIKLEYGQVTSAVAETAGV
jgi:putative ATP-binding cassette transporter